MAKKAEAAAATEAEQPPDQEPQPAEPFVPPVPGALWTTAPERTPGVYARLLHAQQVVEAITREGYNRHHDYRYSREQDIMESCRVALGLAGLAFSWQTIGMTEHAVTTRTNREETQTDLALRLRLTDVVDGSFIEWDYTGRGQDNLDKGINKALVGGVKYGLYKMLMVPTADDAEDSANDDRTGGGATRQAQRGGKWPCPQCGADMYDNRDDPTSSRHGGQRPAFRCKRDKKHVIWGKHPAEEEASEPSEGEPQGQGAAPQPPAQPQGQQRAPAAQPAASPWQARREELGKLTKGQLLTEWNELLQKDGIDLTSVLVLAYAAVDEKVHNEPARWTKDHYVHAIVAAQARGGARQLLEGAMLHLVKIKPATEETSAALREMLAAVEEQIVEQADREWFHDALHSEAEPVVATALENLRSMFPSYRPGEPGKPATVPAGKKPDDDLPF